MENTEAVNELQETEVTPEAPAVQATAPENSGEAPVATPEEKYVPNYKIKAYDNEYEIPEMFRGVMTKENEKEVRAYFEKAYALDDMKPKYQKVQENYKTTSTELTGLKKSIDFLGKFIDEKDFDNFFSRIGIDERDIQEWVRQKLELRSLPPEQQRLYNERVRLRQENLFAQTEREKLESEYHGKLEAAQAQLDEVRYAQLDDALKKPEISQYIEAFDSQNGKNAFKQEVINHAAYVYKEKGIDMTAEQAVQSLLKYSMIGAAKPQATPPQQAVAQPSAKPTIPNVQGRPSSPVGKAVKTLDDLKKLKKDSMNQAREDYLNS